MSNVTQKERIKELEEAVGSIVANMDSMGDACDINEHDLENRIEKLESLTDRMLIAFETTHSRLTNLETKVSQLEKK